MPNVDFPVYGFRFGSLNLIGSDDDLAENGYRFWVLDEDGDLGTPDAIEQEIISWLKDGASVVTQGYTNRSMSLSLMVEGADGTLLAAGESALMLETGGSNTLTYQPADPDAPASVFSVVTSQLEPVTAPVLEREHTRTWGLRITAESFVRSVSQSTVTVAAPTGSQTITSIDACTSATNWTKTIQVGGASATSAAVVTGGTAVQAQASSLSASQTTKMTITRSSLGASMSSTPYLRVDLNPAPSITGGGTWANGTRDLSFSLNGIAAPVAVQAGNIYWFDASALGITTLTTFEATGHVNGTGAGSIFTITVADLSRSDVLGDQGTGRQLTRTLTVAGSARSQGSLAISDASNSLGSVLVYTYPQASGVLPPPLRSLYSTGGGTVTTDTASVYGSTMALDIIASFDVPVSGIAPGEHLLLARVKYSSSGSRGIKWSAQAMQGSNIVGFTPGGGVTVPYTLVANTWKIITVGTVTLPLTRMGPSGKVRINLQDSVGDAVLLDEAWLFNKETGDLTWVECGTGSPAAGGNSNRVWLDSPTLAYPNPAIFLGTAADRSNSYQAGGSTAALLEGLGFIGSFGLHQIKPPVMNVFTVTTNSTASSLTLSHYPRWHTHAAA